jgi:hypothetical protein
MHSQLADPPPDRRRALKVLAALLSLALVVSGCAPYVAVLRPGAPSPAPAATVAPRQHALSILTVDFDPPLDGRTPGIGGVALLVSVRNEGLSEEADVAVTARLLDPASSGNSGELYSDTVNAGALRPGEIRIVRFSPVNGVPAVLGQYQLVVAIRPAANQAYPGDSRTYDILLRRGD